MKIEILKSTFTDNYFYLVIAESGEGALVDPVDAPTALAALELAGVDLKFVLNTHFHGDHIGGNEAVLAAHPDALLVAGVDDADAIEERLPNVRVDRRVRGGEVVTLGDVSLAVIDTPGHTPGHVSFLADGHLFSGDTIFVGGAGNCRFGGDPTVLYQTFAGPLAQLDDGVLFYPGHDYSRRNFEFAAHLQPDHAAVASELAAPSSDGLRVRSLGEERSYNPFFRHGEPALAQALRDNHPAVFETELAASSGTDEAVFRTVRALRNSW